MAEREPAYRRLDVDERRRRLLELGAELFTRHTYAELSMAAIAREAGISKALLYHYFPSKQAFFVATLEQQAAELAAARRRRPRAAAGRAARRRARRLPRLGRGPRGGLRQAARGAATHPEVRELVEGVRDATAQRILAGLAPGAAADAGVRAAVHGWLWFMDGVLTDWLDHRDLDRARAARAAAGDAARRRGGVRAPPLPC